MLTFLRCKRFQKEIKVPHERVRGEKEVNFMSVETLNKADFVAKIAADNQITKKVATEALDIVTTGIKEVLAENKTLRLTGFATFETTYQEEHERKLGFTGETVTVPAGYRHKAKLAEKLKK